MICQLPTFRENLSHLQRSNSPEKCQERLGKQLLGNGVSNDLFAENAMLASRVSWSTLRNIPEEQRSLLHRGGRLT
jgi:hypothetical protein